MRVVNLAIFALLMSLTIPAMAQRPELEGDKIKISVGGSSLSSNNVLRPLVYSLGDSDPSFRVSYNFMGKEKAHELRLGYDHYSGGNSNLGTLTLDYFWKFGSRQEAYYGVGVGGIVVSKGSKEVVGAGTLGINLVKRFFIEARTVSDGSDYITSGFIGLRF